MISHVYKSEFLGDADLAAIETPLRYINIRLTLRRLISNLDWSAKGLAIPEL